MWKKILVPHDFSLCAQRALDLAIDLARAHGSQITLLHVSPLPPNVPPGTMITPPGASAPVRVDEFTANASREKLEAIAAKARGREVEVRTLAFAAIDDVAAEVLTVAVDLGVDVLVLGTHGRTGLAHVLLGSVAEKIVRRASVPVVTVRSPTPEAVPTAEEVLAEDETTG
jgi:nucleotide-binding universal stress UspA family protein